MNYEAFGIAFLATLLVQNAIDKQQGRTTIAGLLTSMAVGAFYYAIWSVQ